MQLMDWIQKELLKWKIGQMLRLRVYYRVIDYGKYRIGFKIY